MVRIQSAVKVQEIVPSCRITSLFTKALSCSSACPKINTLPVQNNEWFFWACNWFKLAASSIAFRFWFRVRIVAYEPFNNAFRMNNRTHQSRHFWLYLPILVRSTGFCNIESLCQIASGISRSFGNLTSSIWFTGSWNSLWYQFPEKRLNPNKCSCYLSSNGRTIGVWIYLGHPPITCNQIGSPDQKWATATPTFPVYPSVPLGPHG